MKNYTTMGSVEVYYDFLNETQSQNIIECIEAIDQDKGFPTGFEDAKVGKGHKGGDIRSNSLFPITRNANTDPMQREYREAVKNGSDTYFKELKESQEYKAHCDYAPHIPRHLSALILLNPTEYEGGGTYFEHFEENIKPEAPALVLFPSNYAYAHRAMPVIKGTKYAIVSWLGHPFDLDGMPVMYKPQGMN